MVEFSDEREDLSDGDEDCNLPNMRSPRSRSKKGVERSKARERSTDIKEKLGTYSKDIPLISTHTKLIKFMIDQTSFTFIET